MIYHPIILSLILLPINQLPLQGFSSISIIIRTILSTLLALTTLYCNKNFPYASKTEAILFVKSLLDNNRDVLYIGDTPSDMKCSYQAGIDFLAVGYGYYDWAIDHRPHLFVNSVADLYLQLHLD